MRLIKFFLSGVFAGFLILTGRADAQITSPAMMQEELIKISGITSDNQIYPLTAAQKQTSRVYYDGFNRPIQAIEVAASPSGKDILA
jgi:hypothetical protein